MEGQTYLYKVWWTDDNLCCVLEQGA